MFTSPGKIAVNIGPFHIHWYGIIIATAFVTGLSVASKIAEKQGLSKEHIINMAGYLLLGAMLGARIYYVLFNWNYYSQNLQEIFMLWYGGISIHGALIGGLITGIIYTKLNRLPLLKYADVLSYGLILGQAIGRWGNFFNSEAFGSPTNLPWKLYIPPESRPEIFKNYSFFHPTFLYESLWDLAVFFLLFFVFRKKFQDKPGAVFFCYLILYSTGRFLIEGIRVDSIYYVFGMPLAQFISILIIILAIFGLYFVTVLKQRLDRR